MLTFTIKSIDQSMGNITQHFFKLQLDSKQHETNNNLD